ncbi:MAG: phosphoglucosamine mutase [Defluviitaleaceae bacterium]|nr:phosphoglucosamine mutase [Defluviitaleaceae bacterium]
MGKLFGTDGVRGLAGEKLSPELAFNLGKAFAYILKTRSEKDIATPTDKPVVLIGKDTRISGDMLEAAIVSGFTSMGVSVILAEVVPTPGVAFLIKKHKAHAGVVISASHNPFMDNGIKFFDKDGYKLSDELENEIEETVLNSIPLEASKYENIGYKKALATANEEYKDFLLNSIKIDDLKGLKIAIDCANGATSSVTPMLFEALSSDFSLIHAEPNGVNINENCGCTHMDSIALFVKENNMDIGIAYDGDGDRCLLIDELGNTIDGDMIMSICAKYMKDNGTLKNNTLVTTIMSNLGLFIMGEKEGITVEKTDVGDKYVLERLLKTGTNFGGEQSGHFIFLDYNTTGDGILTSLYVLKIMKETGKKLSELNKVMKVLPQVLVNAKVSAENKHSYMENAEIKAEIEKLEKKFDGKGRVLIRPSGTENLVRVLIEGEDETEILTEANNLKNLLEVKLCAE